MVDKVFTQVLVFLMKALLNEIEELEKIFLPTAAFKEDYTRNYSDLSFRTDLTSFGLCFKTAVRMFGRMDPTIGQ